MFLLDRLSIQSKLMLMLLLVSIGSLTAISWIAYSSGKAELTTAAFNQLTGIRASRKVQIEAFFKATRISVSHLAEDRVVVGAMHDFAAEIDRFKNAKIEPEWDEKLTAFYMTKFLPQLAQVTGQTPRPEAFLPRTPSARYLQYHYIAANPHRQRYKLDDAGDGSAYSANHARYQPLLSKLISDFGYDNLMLVDSEDGDVVYTFGKTTVLGTNLLDGPYTASAAAGLFKAVRKSMYQGEVPLVDFEPTLYAEARPEALMGAPILDGAKQIGVLLIQFPVDEIDRVMTDNFGWERDGLGHTGEVYLAGPDMLMRSRSRLLYEDKERYYTELLKAGYAPADVAKVQHAATSILTQPVRTKAVEYALAGQEGTAILANYRGIPTLSSYAPLDIPGLRWVVVAEMEASEAFAPLNSLTRKILIWSMVLVLVGTAGANWMGRRFVRPIFKLVDGVRRLREGGKDVAIMVETRDEFADLAAAFNEMSSSVASMGTRLERRTRERDDLLDNLLPAAASERWKRGQDPALDEYPEISVLHANFMTRGEPAMPTGKALELLNDLVLSLDDAAERRGVEKLSCSGSTYVAACGMSRQRLDHASRTVDFAQDIVKRVNRLNRERQANLVLKIGIGSGAATGGVVGRARISYHVTGEPVSSSHNLSMHAPAGSILASRQMYTAVQNLYTFDTPIQVPAPGGEMAMAWPLKWADSREVEAMAQAAGAEGSMPAGGAAGD
jgi:class 3 adenylate cyclase